MKYYTLKNNWKKFLKQESETRACDEGDVISFWSDVDRPFEIEESGHCYTVVGSDLCVEFDMVIEVTKEENPEFFL